MKNSSRSKYMLIALVVVVVVLALLVLLLKHSASTPISTSSNTCISKQLSIGSQGSCVSDAQTMIDFFESDGLNQCPLTGSSPLNVSGSYNVATETQVKIVQTWLNCYNKQEGEATTIKPDGNIDSSTWSALCTYSYIYPSQSQQSASTYLQQSIAAGKNAGCPTG